MPLAPDVVINDAERNRRRRHQDAVVHVLRRHGRQRRPEAPEQDEENVDARVGVVDDAPDAGQVPGAPDELGLGHFARGIRGGECGDEFRDRFAVFGAVGCVRVDLAGCASPEEEGAGDEVGGVEAGGGEGDEVFEGGGGADVDEGEEGGDDGDDGDGDYWDRGAGFDLAVGVSGTVAGGSGL